MRSTVWLFALVSLAGAPTLPAHDAMKNVIRHDATLSVGPRNIDLEIDLTFFSARSAEERFRMDRDNNGQIESSEESAYLDQIAQEVEDRVQFLVDGRPVETFLHYHPELDLLDQRAVEPYPHDLRLFFFARTPSWIRSGSLIQIEDHLWLEGEAVHNLRAKGIDGIEVVADQTGSAVSVEEPYIFSAKCLQIETPIPPTLTPAAAAATSESTTFDVQSWGWRHWALSLWIVLSIGIALFFGQRVWSKSRVARTN